MDNIELGSHWEVEVELFCLEDDDGLCAGHIELRPSLTGTGTAIARCDYHWEKRLDFQEEHERIYPDSDSPPSWFDPEAAGERWDDEY